MSETTVEMLEAIARVLLYCWVFGFVFLLIWFGAYRLLGGFIKRLHGEMFGLSAHEMT